MAYEQAQAGYIKGGVNRILLATDGDFNIGDDPSSVEDLVKNNVKVVLHYPPLV